RLLKDAKLYRYVFADQFTPRSTYDPNHESKLTSQPGQEILSRPIRETDEEALAAFFYSLSDETIRRRWLGPRQHLSHRELLNYLRVDDERNVALVLETIPEGEQAPEIIGVGRYHASNETNLADVAVLIGDDYQGQGLGAQLFLRLSQIAQTSGLDGFTASVLTENGAMMKIFRSSKFELSETREGTTYEVTIFF
ncbi:MAG: GNAT family N-acetyltransferase, partial [Polyangiaceae bacterium]|nr:GNAT family N-acetyltransferase [Polyangiaceae bacterium]